MRGTLRQVLAWTFGLAALVIVLEHAGGFSKALTAAGNLYKTGYQTLTKV